MNDLSVPTPNIPLLRKAVEWAEAEAAKTDGPCMWNQHWYAEPMECGTAYCIAGFSIMAAVPGARVVDGEYLEIGGEEASWWDAGIAVLGLRSSEGCELFAGSNTIADVRTAAERIAARAGERL